MAFDPLERLEQGNIDFLFDRIIGNEWHADLIKRIRKSENKYSMYSIINGCIDKLKDTYPSFCMNIIYDMNEYKEYVFYILEHSESGIFYYFGTTELVNILRKTNWGKNFIFNHLDEILEKDNQFLQYLFEYIFEHFEECKDFIDKLYLHHNLRIRGEFMCYLVEYHYDKVNAIYDDITKYLTSYTHQQYEQITFLPELMPYDTISKLTINFLQHGNKTTYDKLKEYIFKNYQENDLSLLLMSSNDEVFKQEFLSDINRYFSTSYQCQFQIYEDYSNNLSEEILNSYQKFLLYFRKPNYYGIYDDIENLTYYGLGNLLKKICGQIFIFK